MSEPAALGTTEPSPRRRPALALDLALLATVAALLFHEALLRSHTFVGDDIGGFHRPLKWTAARLFAEGHGLPLWNPWDSAGQPFAANPQNQVFHPLTLLFALLPFEWAFRLQIILPVLVAGLTMGGLARAAGASGVGARLAAVVWAFGGYTLSCTNLWPTLFSIAVLPATLAAALRVGRGSVSRANLAGLALAFALQCLAGEPVSLLLTPPLALVAGLHGAAISGRRIGARRLGVLAAGLALGAVLAAPNLLPGLAHARLTLRSGGLEAAEAQAWSLAPARAAELVAPPFLVRAAHGARDWAWLAELYPEQGRPYFYSLYPGLLAALLALLAWLQGPAPLRLWLVPAGLGLLLALGRHAPAWALARRLPFLDSVRYPEKLVLPALLALALAAAFGCDRLLVASARERRALFRVLLALGLLALLAIATVPDLPRPEHTRRLAADLARLAAVALGGAMVIRAARARSALVVLVAADLLLAGRSLVSTRPAAEVASLPSALAAVTDQPARGYLFHQASLAADAHTGPAPGAPPLPVLWDIATALDLDFDRTELAWSAEATKQVWTAMSRLPGLAVDVLARRHIAWVASWTSGDPAAPGRRPRLELLPVPEPAPFAFFAERVLAAPGGEGWLAALPALGHSCRTAAILDSPAERSLPEISAGRVLSLERSSDRIRLEVQVTGPGPGFLAVNQTWDAGWRARLSGGSGAAAATIERVEVSLSGLYVPPGRHRVELAYRNRLVVAGEVVALGGLLALLVLLWLGPRAQGLRAIVRNPRCA